MTALARRVRPAEGEQPGPETDLGQVKGLAVRQVRGSRGPPAILGVGGIKSPEAPYAAKAVGGDNTQSGRRM